MYPGQGREHRPEVIAAAAPRLPQRRRVFRRLAIATSSHPLPLNPQYGVSRLPPVWQDRRVMSHFPHFARTLFSSLSVGGVGGRGDVVVRMSGLLVLATRTLLLRRFDRR